MCTQRSRLILFVSDRWTAVPPCYAVCLLNVRGGKLEVMRSRLRWAPLLGTCCFPQLSWPMEVGSATCLWYTLGDNFAKQNCSFIWAGTIVCYVLLPSSPMEVGSATCLWYTLGDNFAKQNCSFTHFSHGSDERVFLYEDNFSFCPSRLLWPAVPSESFHYLGLASWTSQRSVPTWYCTGGGKELSIHLLWGL